MLGGNLLLCCRAAVSLRQGLRTGCPFGSRTVSLATALFQVVCTRLQQGTGLQSQPLGMRQLRGDDAWQGDLVRAGKAKALTTRRNNCSAERLSTLVGPLCDHSMLLIA